MSEKLVLIDGHSILNRAFFGLPDLTNSEGLHTNAVYGFLNIMFKILEEEKPNYLTVAFDLKAPTFRHKMFEAYKGTRKPMAEELRQQVPLMKEMLRAMGVKVVELEGYEADDLLGTIAFKGEKEGMQVAVVSGDRDLLQLATDHIQIRIPKTKKTGTEIENYYAKDVIEKYQVTPREFIDVKALMGDTADNIPGVPGIGEKTAEALIVQYKSIENVHEHAAEVKPPRAATNIVEYWDQAVMSKELATICVEAPIEYDFKDARLEAITDLYTQDAFVMCKRLEFKNLLSRFSVDAKEAEVSVNYTCIETRKEADAVWNKAKGKHVAFAITPKSEDASSDGQMSLFAPVNENTFGGMAIAFSPEDVYYMKCGDELTSEAIGQSLIQCEASSYSVMELKELLKELPFSDDMKLHERSRFFDASVAAYLINPLKGEYPFDDIAKDHLGIMLPGNADFVNKEKEDYVGLACHQAYVALLAKEPLEKKLKETGMNTLFEDIEMPLIFVLADMEQEGICMDASALKEYGQKLAVSIEELEKRIYEEAGEEFNINSPKQLGVILFEQLGLPNGKKTKTGYSTSAEVLDKLAFEYPIVKDILEYRQLTKLKSTYADGLMNYIEEDGKIRTSFNQTITATGRLSSTEPNLQNIPIRIELGKMIRKVFHPMKGNLFVDSDYSQIELRVLAHMSGDENLIEAFQRKQDIHRTTASQVFNVPFEEVTDLQRRNAKAVNFGIVYGISAHGLSQDLDISRKEAQEYIDKYFATYPKIKEYLDKTVEDAKATGSITTLFGRIRPIPELSSSNFMQRQFGERVAMNSPIQGTAADIIKIAMIRVHDRLLQEKYESKLILQVHDELLIETKECEKEQVIALLEEEMQHAVNLSVDMEVGTECGYDWYEAH